jgi:decaprenyl-phosphate phosphoribosyltransferase
VSVATSARGVLRLLRARQWTKNLLVAAAPLAAGVLFETAHLRSTVVAVIAFCLASSATYCVNDVMDRHVDALHPDKRHRPVASGAVPAPVALLVAVLLAATAVLLSPGELRLVVAVYLLTTTCYSLWLKHQPVVELGLVAAGFILRAFAGGPANDLALSPWFVIVTAFSALFVVAAKRLSERIRATAGGHAMRRSVAAYPASYLRSVMTVSAAAAVCGYCLWVFEGTQHLRGGVVSQASVAPFTLAVLRYALVAEHGDAEAPEVTFAKDRALQVLGVAWLVLFEAGTMWVHP